jgi:hypothetical protein
MKEIVSIAQQQPAETKIYLDSPSSSPYIYFLFYAPEKYQPLVEQIAYFPATSEGFRHVQKIGNIIFVEQIDFTDVENRDEPALIAVTQQKIPGDLFSRPGFREFTRLEKRYDEQEWVVVMYEPSIK